MKQWNVSPKKLLLSIIIVDVTAILAGYLVVLVRRLSLTTYAANNAYLDYLSFAQILCVSVLALIIFFVRLKQESTGNRKKTYIVWAIIGLGIMLFALDQLLQVHDDIGTRIVTFFNIHNQTIAGRGGDFVLLFSGFIGLLVIILFRNEFKNYTKSFSYLVPLIPIVIILAGLYALTTRTDILNNFISNESSAEVCWSWL